jgi:hypothetical protein
MRDLTIEELGHVYGAGGSSKPMYGDNQRGSKGSKHSKQHASKGSKGSKQHASKGSKGSGHYS